VSDRDRNRDRGSSPLHGKDRPDGPRTSDGFAAPEIMRKTEETQESQETQVSQEPSEAQEPQEAGGTQRTRETGETQRTQQAYEAQRTRETGEGQRTRITGEEQKTQQAGEGHEAQGMPGGEEPFDAHFFPEDEEEGEIEPPAFLKWLKRGAVALIALALIGNVFAIFPMVYNMEMMRFLRDTRELQQLDVIREYKRSIVVVDAGDSKGTGFNIDEKGLIVTNHHVMGAAETAVVGFPDGRTFHARVAVRDPERDIALLSLGDTGQTLPALKVNPDRVLEPGMRVYYIGNPLFFRHIAGEGAIIGMRSQDSLAAPVLLIDAPIFKGNSGSPVLTEDGEVIGVIFAMTQAVLNGQKIDAGLAVAAEGWHGLLE